MIVNTVSEEQVLFNKLNWENQQMILRIMRCLQPCELSCEIEEEKKIPEKLNYQYRNLYGRLSQHKQSEIDIIDTLNGVIDYLKNKGE